MGIRFARSDIPAPTFKVGLSVRKERSIASDKCVEVCEEGERNLAIYMYIHVRNDKRNMIRLPIVL